MAALHLAMQSLPRRRNEPASLAPRGHLAPSNFDSRLDPLGRMQRVPAIPCRRPPWSSHSRNANSHGHCHLRSMKMMGPKSPLAIRLSRSTRWQPSLVVWEACPQVCSYYHVGPIDSAPCDERASLLSMKGPFLKRPSGLPHRLAAKSHTCASAS